MWAFPASTAAREGVASSDRLATRQSCPAEHPVDWGRVFLAREGGGDMEARRDCGGVVSEFSGLGDEVCITSEVGDD